MTKGTPFQREGHDFSSLKCAEVGCRSFPEVRVGDYVKVESDSCHVARAQTSGTGLNIGVILLERLIRGSSAVTPIAWALIANSYGRSEKVEADRHGVEIVRRAGYSKEVMIDTLTWLMRTSGGDTVVVVFVHAPGNRRQNRRFEEIEIDDCSRLINKFPIHKAWLQYAFLQNQLSLIVKTENLEK